MEDLLQRQPQTEMDDPLDRLQFLVGEIAKRDRMIANWFSFCNHFQLPEQMRDESLSHRRWLRERKELEEEVNKIDLAANQY